MLLKSILSKDRLCTLNSLHKIQKAFQIYQSTKRQHKPKYWLPKKWNSNRNLKLLFFRHNTFKIQWWNSPFQIRLYNFLLLICMLVVLYITGNFHFEGIKKLEYRKHIRKYSSKNPIRKTEKSNQKRSTFNNCLHFQHKWLLNKHRVIHRLYGMSRSILCVRFIWSFHLYTWLIIHND